MRRGFTLVEAAIATAILGVLVVTALNALGALGVSRRKISDRALAEALADDLAGEVQGVRYRDPGTPNAAPGPDLDDFPSGRAGYDDVDDYDGLAEAPPVTLAGKAMASRAWSRNVKVTWMQPASLRGLERSAADRGLKQITITVSQNGVELARREIVRSLAWDEAVP